MCALYGFVNYGKVLSQKELKKLVRRLSVTCPPPVCCIGVQGQRCFWSGICQKRKGHYLQKAPAFM